MTKYRKAKGAKTRSRSQTLRGKAPGSGREARPQKSVYADGHEFDGITYLEAKLILKPNNFTSVQSFRDFGKLVKRSAKKAGVGFIPDAANERHPDIREIVFFDTPGSLLYNHAFILRRRISYVDGFPVGDPEVVFKFRHPDEQKATSIDVRPRIRGAYDIKFKAEVLPLKHKVGGYRILFSHNCQFGLSQVRQVDKTLMSTLVRVLPPVTSLKRSSNERINLVNHAIVEELLLPLGRLDFGRGQVGKCDISLWRTRGEHRPLVGEFAFQVKFPDEALVGRTPKRLAARFYLGLQADVEKWLALGVTKTAMVYRLNGNPPQSHE